MKSKSVFFKAMFGITCGLLVSFALADEARADGTEQLGPPSIPIADGSSVIVEGVGLTYSQPGDISVEIPAGANIAQVLLYWSGRSVEEGDAGVDDTIQVNGMDVTGPRIGGPTLPPFPSNTYRADITASNWVVEGAVNVLSISGLDFTYQNDGAAVVVILDDGSMVDLQIMDGNDFAYLPDGYQTVPVDIPVAPAGSPRSGTLTLIVGDIAVPRPAAVEVVVGGVTNLLDDVLQDNEGSYLDVVVLDVPVPAGVTNVTVRVLSIDDGSGLNPASLSWSFVAWTLPEPPMGCTYTIGYWKNHPDDWPTDELTLWTKHEAMMALWTAPRGGNAFIILAHQYIGAELNVVNGTSIPDDVLDAWLDAQDLLVEYWDEGDIPKKTEDRDWAIYLAGILDDYNNGLLGPCHCD